MSWVSLGQRANLGSCVVKAEVVSTRVARIWADVLGVDSVPHDASFFELGGHSLLAIRVMSRVQEQFGVDVPLAELFRYPTVTEFAGVIVGAAPAEAAIAPSVPLVENVPVPDALSGMLDTIAQLSDDEAAQLLAMLEEGTGEGAP